MRKKMLCLHAASTNITLVEQAISQDIIQLNHVVDTELMTMIRDDLPIHKQIEYVTAMLESLLAKNPDNIFITCTNYIALLDKFELKTSIPILKIDELLFEQLSVIQTPIKLLFTNKNTIEGTMARLNVFLSKPLTIEVLFIPELFDWYITGDKKRHDEALQNYLRQLNDTNSTIAVAQLSMSDAAEQFNKTHHTNIVHPLSALQHYVQS